MEDEIASAYEAWNLAFNRGDARAIALLYSENARLLPPTHDVVEGRQAIEEFWAGLVKAGVTGHTLDLITAGGGHQGAVGAAKWSAKGKDSDGTEQAFGGSAVHVFERRNDGGLTLWLHTWN